MITPRKVQELYRSGQNITSYLRDQLHVSHNSREIIELAYDVQAGSYVAAMSDQRIATHKQEYSKEVARIINELGKFSSILEAGVGEATTLSGLLTELSAPGIKAHGFDISWSRAAHAKRWLQACGIPGVQVCTGELAAIPFKDNSIDVVFTSHSVEPNGGSEENIIRELYRVARKFLILLEPAYDLATEPAQRRMKEMGYCTDIIGAAQRLGYRVDHHALFPHCINPLNPTAITIIRKTPVVDSAESNSFYMCPRYRAPLASYGDNALYSEDGLLVYPIIGEIPCLRAENGILASCYPEMMMKETRGVEGC